MTDKTMTKKDDEQVQRYSYNDVNATFGVDGFIVGAINRRVTATTSTTNVSNDTVTFDFFQNTSELLYSIRVIYTDGSQSTFMEAERIA